MSRVRYAGEFLNRCRQARQEYQEIHKPGIERMLMGFARENEDATRQTNDDSLEIHIREYFINTLLSALNWTLSYSFADGLPKLIPESPVTSVSKGTRRYLDYFGFEQETGTPLLIVETKRPNSPLPEIKESKDKLDLERHNVNRDAIPAIDRAPSIISAGLSGIEGGKDLLSGEWNEWLKALKDYVQSVNARCNQVPKRAVLTSGRWMIIFIDPADSFLPSGSHDAGRILAYELADDEWNESPHFQECYNEIFGWLEYQLVRGKNQTLSIAEVEFYLRASQLAKALHGLRLLYISEPDFWGSAKPQIKVAPVIFLLSTNGDWLTVERKESDERLPHSYDQLSTHLVSVEEKAKTLLAEINDRLGTLLEPSTIEQHYSISGEEFDHFPGVRMIPGGSARAVEYLIVTGQHTHYLKPEPSVPNCPYHDWNNSNQERVAEPVGSPVVISNVELRSFFLTGQKHHCTHRNVALIKISTITPQNLDFCGRRSGKNNDAFCEIIGFEKYLCCRTCVYENVCAKAQVFRLPCSAATVHA